MSYNLNIIKMKKQIVEFMKISNRYQFDKKMYLGYGWEELFSNLVEIYDFRSEEEYTTLAMYVSIEDNEEIMIVKQPNWGTKDEQQKDLVTKIANLSGGWKPRGKVYLCRNSSSSGSYTEGFHQIVVRTKIAE